MPDFDKERAYNNQMDVIRAAERARATLDSDVIGYYRNSSPQSDDEVRKNNDGMRRYLGRAMDEINSALRAIR